MKKVLGIAAALLLLALCLTPVAAANSADEVTSTVDGIVKWNLNRSGSASVQEWIDGELTENAGVSSEWYILTLRQSGDYDFSSYVAALDKYVKTTPIRAATDRLKYALTQHAVGLRDGHISDALDESVGEGGIMSLIYGLHIMNNGYSCEKYTSSDVVGVLLSHRHDDGGWSLTGDRGDVDVTAMTVGALAPYYGNDPDVTDAVDGALAFLSSRQQDDGGYMSYGVRNPESAAQVLVALSSLGIDCISDARFIKGGSTVIDGIVKYRLPDGSFSHTEGGSSNGTATVQALYSLVAYLRMKDGKSPLYIFDTRTSEDTAAESGSAVTTADDAESPDTSGTETVTPPGTAGHPDKGGYKPWAVAVIIILGGAACLVLFLSGKRSIKNFIAVMLITALLVLTVIVTNLASADDYYCGVPKDKENAVGTVTLTIRCDTVSGKTDAAYIPEDGVILDVTDFAVADGETVCDILIEAAQRYGIRIEVSGGGNTAYIKGINFLYEYDFGDLSGWVYRVNGVSPQIGCGEYTLSDGDSVEWLYTCDLGGDLK